jgi:catechol 2,3-dioxygenase-like lactoylglutathione lyase family enzyme
MPFIFEQPNLDNEDENHLYFDPGDSRLITIFTDEKRLPNKSKVGSEVGSVHHIALDVSAASFSQIVNRLEERQIAHSGPKDRGFMDSIYFRDPLGLLIEIASYRFTPPIGTTHADVLREAHLIRLELGEYNINQKHLALAIEKLSKSMRPSLSK